MKKALIVYASRTGDTRKIAELVAEGIRFSGNEAVIEDAKNIKKEGDLADYDAYVFGSATYHGQMLPAMKTMLFLGEKAGLKGKIGGSFGAFGWSGEAPDKIFGTMQQVFEMDMVSAALRLKNAQLGGGVQMAQDYGKDIAAKMA